MNGEEWGTRRLEVVIGSLLDSNDVRVVASGTAYRHLRERLPRVDEIFGPTFAMEEGEINRWATMRQNVQHAFDELPGTVKRWVREVDEWKPDVVISDFEPLAGVYARGTRTPLIAVDNINMLDRCRHDDEIIGAHRQDYLLARAVAHSMVPGAVEYIVTTFFEPPLARGGTTLVPPIIRPEIVAAQRARRAPRRVLERRPEADRRAARGRDAPARVYGMRGGPRRGRDRRMRRASAALGRGLRRVSAHRARRDRRRRLLAAERGGLPRQADPRGAAATDSNS